MAAIASNAGLNGASIAVTSADLLDTIDTSWEVVTAGDVCYERAMADRVTPSLAALVARGQSGVSRRPRGAPICRGLG
jgi:predicted nicotinamide N-methyase